MIQMNRMTAFHVEIGQAVALFPDQRDRSTQSRHGIHGIVFETSESSLPSVRIAIPEGIIGDKRGKKAIWYPPDMYSVIHSSLPLGGARRILQDSIKTNSFNKEGFPIISIRDAHRMAYSGNGDIQRKQQTGTPSSTRVVHVNAKGINAKQ